MKVRYLIIGMLLIASFEVLSDGVVDQINLGLEAYEAQDYKAAIDELNYAIAEMQEKLNSQNATLLPAPLEGWTASEVENMSGGMAMMGGGTHMSRSYSREGENVEISIMAGSPMMAGALAMINNPMLLNSSPDTKPYRYKRIKGMQQTSDGQIEITLAVAGQIMVQVKGSGTDDATIKQYLDVMDFEALQSALLH